MPKIILSSDQIFSLSQTLGCGQVFRWEYTPTDDWWHGVVGPYHIHIRQEGETLIYYGAPGSFIKNYFALDLNLDEILISVDKDHFIHNALTLCRGLRIVRQPRWESILSYICATNSNIPTIKRRITSLAQIFGDLIPSTDFRVYTLPSPRDISCTSLEELDACKLGYRREYIFNTSSLLEDFTTWEAKMVDLPTEELRKNLIKLPGVGPKVADCILLFGFERYEVFPVDVWIRRMMQHYIHTSESNGGITGREYALIREFARKYFGDHCGYAQEYLYAARKERYIAPGMIESSLRS